MKDGAQNESASSVQTHIPADTDRVIMLSAAVQRAWPDHGQEGGHVADALPGGHLGPDDEGQGRRPWQLSGPAHERHGDGARLLRQRGGHPSTSLPISRYSARAAC